MPMLPDAFSWVCGQAADRTWAPGGEGLPFCQRCTGLYVGAIAALTLVILVRTAPGPRRLGFAGLCLAQMVPLGFHWVEHGPTLRTLSGWLFAFGLVDFLWLLPASAWRPGQAANPAWRDGVQAVICGAGSAGLLLAVQYGGVATARALAWLGLAGLVGLSLLVSVNLTLLGFGAWRWLRPRSPRLVP